MRKLLYGLIALVLIGGCVAQNTPQLQSPNQLETESVMPNPTPLPDLGPAPELTNITWLNVDSPLRLADLRGKVVMIDMWTFG